MAGMTMVDASASATMERLLWAVGRAGHRDPLVGLRQHRHALPGLAAGRRAPHRRGEGRRRRHGAPLHGHRQVDGPAHPLGQGRRLRRARATTSRVAACEVGAINSNTFQDADYMLGSLCHPSAEVRAKAVAAIIECCRIAATMDASAVKVWLGDGTNYPGQDDLRHRRHRLVEGLKQVYAGAPRAGPHLPRVQALRAGRLLDRRAGLGPGAGRLPPRRRASRRLRGHRPPLAGRQHRADRGAAAGRGPAGLLRPQRQEVRRRRPDGRLHRPLPALPHRARARERHARRQDPGAQRCARETAYMLDQCHNIEPKVPAMIRSVMNLQEIFAKALLVDREALVAAQARGDVLEANGLLWAAFSHRRARARSRAARGARSAGRSLSRLPSTAARPRRARRRASEARPPAGRPGRRRRQPRPPHGRCPTQSRRDRAVFVDTRARGLLPCPTRR